MTECVAFTNDNQAFTTPRVGSQPAVIERSDFTSPKGWISTSTIFQVGWPQSSLAPVNSVLKKADQPERRLTGCKGFGSAVGRLSLIMASSQVKIRVFAFPMQQCGILFWTTNVQGA